MKKSNLYFALLLVFFCCSCCKKEENCNRLSSDSVLDICDVCPEGTVYLPYNRCKTLRKGQYWGYKKDSGLMSDTIVLHTLWIDSFRTDPTDFNINFRLYDTKAFMTDWSKSGRYYHHLQDSFYIQKDLRQIPYFDNTAKATMSGQFLNKGKQMKLVFHFTEYDDHTELGDCEFLLNRVE